MTMDTYNCIICDKGKVKGRSMVKNCTQESVSNIKDFAEKRLRYGETKYTPLFERLSMLSNSDLEHIHYHKECYKLLVHKGMLERTEKRFC